MIKTTLYAVLCALLTVPLAACDNKGPVEQVGEEVDEAVNTVREGGESTATKVDDAIDEVREGVKDAAEEVKGN